MKKTLAFILAVIMLLGVLSGCGKTQPSAAATQSSGAAAPADSSAAQDQPAAESEASFNGEFKIAMLTYLSGTGRETGDRQIAAAQLAVDRINAAGGVNGAEVVLEFFDCGADQQACVNAAQLAVNTEGVSGIIGVYPSTNNIAFSDLIEKAKIPTICLGNSSAVRNLNLQYMWIPRVCDDLTTSTLAKLCIQKGIEKPCVIWMTNAAGQTAHDVFEKYYSDQGKAIGLDLGFTIETETDYTPMVTQFLNSDCDGLVIMAYSHQGNPEIFTLLNQYGYDITKVAGTSPMFSADLTDMIGDMVDGAFGVAEFSPIYERPGTQEYVKAFEASQNTFTASWTDAVTYDAVALLCEAARLAGSNDPVEVNKGFEKMDIFTDGALTDYSYYEDHNLGNSLLVTEYEGSTISFSDVIAVR